MTYYNYRQNNSGGSFVAPAVSVFIKADSPEQADAIALANGIYFDPTFEIDCDCCGNRWSSAVEWGVSTSDEVEAPSDWVLSWAISDGIPAQLVIE
jgi:hypothetical protein